MRSHLEYAVYFWSPYYIIDINIPESIEIMIKKNLGLGNLPFRERLWCVSFHSVKRLWVGGMTEV